MGRTAIETWLRMMEIAYKDDPFGSLLRNLKGITAEEWATVPETWSKEEFGDEWGADLAIRDLTLHVAGAKYMYADRAFGDASMEWETVPRPASFDMETVLAYLEAGYQQLASGLAALTDDAQLDEMRQAPWRTPMTVLNLMTLMISHDLYHSGEINRQRALIRGAKGWTNQIANA